MPINHRKFNTDPLSSRLSRRHLLAGAATTTVAVSFPLATAAQNGSTDETDFPPYGTPASTADVSVELDEFRALCQRLAGIEDDLDLDDESLQQLLKLLLQQEEGVENPHAAGLRELLDTGGVNVDRASLSYAANTTLTSILAFLFLGEFDGASLDNRHELYPQLVSYRLLPYASTPALCKGDEYWAQDPEMPDRS